MTARQIIKKLESLGNPANIAGMARFGIVTKKSFGVFVPVLKELVIYNFLVAMPHFYEGNISKTAKIIR